MLELGTEIKSSDSLQKLWLLHAPKECSRLLVTEKASQFTEALVTRKIGPGLCITIVSLAHLVHFRNKRTLHRCQQLGFQFGNLNTSSGGFLKLPYDQASWLNAYVLF